MDTDQRVERVAEVLDREIGGSGGIMLDQCRLIARIVLAAADAVDDGWELTTWFMDERGGVHPYDLPGRSWRQMFVRRSVTPPETADDEHTREALNNDPT